MPNEKGTQIEGKKTVYALIYPWLERLPWKHHTCVCLGGLCWCLCGRVIGVKGPSLMCP